MLTVLGSRRPITVSLALLAATAISYAQPFDPSGVWRQDWQSSPDKPFETLGVIQVERAADCKLRMNWVSPSYITREVRLPEGVKDIAVDAKRWRCMLDLGPSSGGDPAGGEASQEPLLVQFDLASRSEGVFEGPARLQGREIGRTRFVRFADDAAVREWLGMRALEAEALAAAMSGSVRGQRDGLLGLERLMEDERRRGFSTGHSMTQMQYSIALGALGADEIYLMGLYLRHAALLEMITRMDAAPATTPMEFAESPGFAGYWRQSWMGENGTYFRLGLLMASEDEGVRQLVAIPCAYTSRLATAPTAIRNLRCEHDRWTADLEFPPELVADEAGKTSERKREGRLALERRGPSSFEGTVTLGDQVIGRTRFDRISKEEEPKEFQRIKSALDLELQVSRRSLEIYRAGARTFEAFLQLDANAPRATTGTMTRIAHLQLQSAADSELARTQTLARFLRELEVLRAMR